MAENRSTNWACGEADEIGAERQQRRGGRIGVREIKLAEDQSGGGPIKEEIVPFDRGADRGGDHCLAQLARVVGRGKRAVSGYRTHKRPPLDFPIPLSRGVIPGAKDNLRPYRGKHFRKRPRQSILLASLNPASAADAQCPIGPTSRRHGWL